MLQNLADNKAPNSSNLESISFQRSYSIFRCNKCGCYSCIRGPTKISNCSISLCTGIRKKMKFQIFKFMHQKVSKNNNVVVKMLSVLKFRYTNQPRERFCYLGDFHPTLYLMNKFSASKFLF